MKISLFVYRDELLIHDWYSCIVNSCERVVFSKVDGGVKEPWGVVHDAEQQDDADDGVGRVDVASVEEKMIAFASVRREILSKNIFLRLI